MLEQRRLWIIIVDLGWAEISTIFWSRTNRETLSRWVQDLRRKNKSNGNRLMLPGLTLLSMTLFHNWVTRSFKFLKRYGPQAKNNSFPTCSLLYYIISWKITYTSIVLFFFTVTVLFLSLCPQILEDVQSEIQKKKIYKQTWMLQIWE